MTRRLGVLATATAQRAPGHPVQDDQEAGRPRHRTAGTRLRRTRRRGVLATATAQRAPPSGNRTKGTLRYDQEDPTEAGPEGTPSGNHTKGVLWNDREDPTEEGHRHRPEGTPLRQSH